MNGPNLNNLDWGGFENLVYQIQASDFLGAQVLLDARIADLITGKPRQVDIAIRVPKHQGSYLIAVECKHYKTRKITQPNVEQFASFLKSIGADKGVMVASSGYSESAAIYAHALDINLYSVIEAEGLKWQEFIAQATRPAMKKRLSSADISILAGTSIVTLDRDVLLGKGSDLNIYAKENGSYIPMDVFRKKHKGVDYNFFVNMPQLPGLLFELIEEQVTTKLNSSKADQFDRLRADIKNETQQTGLTSYINHLIYDKASEVSLDEQSKIAWWARVVVPMREVQASFRRYLHLEDGFAPIDEISLIYRAEISVGRYHGTHELSPLDLCSGIAYVDAHSESQRFYVWSELYSQKPREKCDAEQVTG